MRRGPPKRRYYYYVHHYLSFHRGHLLFRTDQPTIGQADSPHELEEYLDRDGNWSGYSNRSVATKTFREGVQRIKQVVGNVTVSKYGF